MTNLKEYIDFAHSLIGMEEVVKNKFPLPTEITFKLPKVEHAALQTQIHDAKKLKKEDFQSQEEFILSVLNIDFKFVQK